MTINSNTRKAGPFVGNGVTTTFPFTFKVFAAADLLVVRVNTTTNVETTLVLGTDYSVTLNAEQNSSPGGNVVLTSPLATGNNMVITSDIQNLQPTDLTNQGGFYPDVINDALDRATIQIQQLQEGVDRSAKLPITSAEDANALVADIVRIADSANNLDTVATNIANVNTVAGISANVTTVAGISGNVTTVAGISANVTTVAGVAANVTTVATNIANVNTVAGNSANVTTVATNIASVNTNASNIAAINTNASNIVDIQNAATNAATATTQAGIATTQASNAANSAAQAAASAASGMYSGVQDKSANYTVVAADAGDLIRVTTTGGAVTITLPQISTVGDGFKVAIVKWTGDTNQVTIARSGSDTINGATSATITSQYTQIMLVADFETNQWFASTSGLGATNVVVDRYSGTGSQTAFTLSGDPGTLNNTYVFVGGVYQQKNTYSVSGTTLTFTAAPPAGTNNVEVVWTQPLAVGVPSDGTVTPAKINPAGTFSFNNVNIPGSGGRITGDFSNATLANRVAFQTSTTNGITHIEVIPNGTATQSGIKFETDPNIANGSTGTADIIGGSSFQISSSIRGTGTYLPMTFFTGGSEQLRIATTGRVTPQKSSNGVILTLTDGATITPDFEAANMFRVQLGGNRTLATPTNLVEGQSGSIDIYQDNTGSRTLAYEWAWDFIGGVAPTLSTNARARDKLVYQVDVAKSSTVTITIASPGVVSWTAHGLLAGSQVRLTTTGALPTGLAANTTYYVIPVDANSFQLSATQSGTAINTSGSQSGTHTMTARSITAQLLATII